MPRKQFNADVQLIASGTFPGIANVSRGDDDGEVFITYVPAFGLPIEISLVSTDVSSYPSDSNFMAFAKSEGVPGAVGDLLGDVFELSNGMALPELINTISEKLRRVLATGSQDDPLSLDSDMDMDGAQDDSEASHSEQEDEEDEEEEYIEDDFKFNDFHGDSPHTTSRTNFHLSTEAARALNLRIKSDMKAVKLAGFNIGRVNGLKADTSNNIMSISKRVARLGLSEEVVQAWNLEPHQYIVLLIRFSGSYKTFEEITRDPARFHEISFRIGVCDKYKPTHAEAQAAFIELFKNETASADVKREELLGHANGAGFSNMFISSSLNEFINTQFISILKIRSAMGLGWDGAKQFFNEKQGFIENIVADSAEFAGKDDDTSAQKDALLHDTIGTDHLTNDQVTQVSFPLIAAQFAWRYLIRCTDFCLVCHDQIENEFEALKPYVCSKPLCLYQYMSLGFGPSVEHEILAQPYVVDLLVSFCYASAQSRALREYPTGMSLIVPPATTYQTTAAPSRAIQPVAPLTPKPVIDLTNFQLDVKFDQSQMTVDFDLAKKPKSPVKVGDWIVLILDAHVPDHYRVEDCIEYPRVKLCAIAATSLDPRANPIPGVVPVTPATTPPPSSFQTARVLVYQHNFDDMAETDKAETIVSLLNTLPRICDLKDYLVNQSRVSEPNLKAWKDRVSPAALGLLRWIIASNRSCIVQVDKCPGQTDDEVTKAKVRLDQRVSNITEDWVQFRFAQGSPDKEQRFLAALKENKDKLKPKYPTLFAWHGSALANWHSIIRTGLDFKQVLNGRAYGHGVYHAADQATSIGYAQPYFMGSWCGSTLNITTAMSLNEIVNCPAEFTSTSPYLVVQYPDWIQCRYLFVRVQQSAEGYGNPASSANTLTKPPGECEEVEQDSIWVAKSTLSKPIGVPTCAVSVSRKFRTDQTSGDQKKKGSKRIKSPASGPSGSSEDYSPVSEGENLSDLEFLFSDDEKDPGLGNSAGLKKKIDKPLTDFIPDSLDQASLPMLEPPAYATPTASKTLNRNLREVLELQAKIPLHELGWYINKDLISNIYQWIVELHSFDPSIPLAKDMKAAGMTSIVLEIRFGKDYPYSPPFLRIIRPRFLSFAAGGGGHVTAGGAMCMELLTNSGWSSVSTIESVLLQVRLAIMSTDPKPARLENAGKHLQRDYSTGEAIEAYIRACQMHGWQVPPGFREGFGV